MAPDDSGTVSSYTIYLSSEAGTHEISPPITPNSVSVSANCPFVAETLGTEMILGFASRYACLGDLDKWAASRLQVACK